MRVIYNGVDLLAIQTHYFNWEPVYDENGVDYLYTRVSGAWRGVINGIASVIPLQAGQFMNYDFLTRTPTDIPVGGLRTATTGQNPRFGIRTSPTPTPPGSEGLSRALPQDIREIVLNPPANLPGNDPTNTHASIRHRLSTPRGKLYVFWGQGMESGSPVAGSDGRPGQGGRFARIFVESPEVDGSGIDLSCDCKNGPFPKLLGVVESVGDSLTMMVDFGVETFVNEANLNGVTPQGGLLSNRFSQMHDIKNDSYTTITTQGTAVFRTDFVYALPQAPDSIRNILFMPIPQGFKRDNIRVVGRPDVTGVEYSYDDVQQSVNFVAGPFTKAASISAVHRQAVFNQPDIWANSPLAAYERVLGIQANKNFAKGDAPEDKKAEDKAMRKFARMFGRSLAKELRGGGKKRGRPAKPGGAGGP